MQLCGKCKTAEKEKGGQKMKKILSLVFAVLLTMAFAACGSEVNKSSIERNKQILDEIDDVQEKSDHVSDLIDQYKNGK